MSDGVGKAARGMIVALVLAAVVASAGSAWGDDRSGQVWVISTRQALRCGQPDLAAAGIAYWRLEGGNRWQPAGLAEFLAGDPAVPTTFFIHGNRENYLDAVNSASPLDCRMERVAAGRPFRFVIWSWPSDRIAGRNRQDVQVKACYSDVEAYYLAAHLKRMNPDAPVSLIGYSFGARIITGALHALAGGAVAGRALPSQDAAEKTSAPRKPVRAVLVAAAVDAGVLLPHGRHSLALSQAERILITENCCDPVLRWYPRMYGRRGPQAMGFVGPAWYGATEQLDVLNVSGSVGQIHDWLCYLRSPGLNQRLADYTFLDATTPAAPAAPAAPASTQAAPGTPTLAAQN